MCILTCWHLLSVTGSQQPFFERGRTDNDSALAEMLLHGQVFLEVDRPEDLAALRKLSNMPNPYDPVARAEQGLDRFGDQIFYRGHLTLYQGIIPVLLYYVPLKALTDFSPTVGFLRAFHMLLCFVFVLGIFHSVTMASCRKVPRYLVVASLLLAGLSSPVLYVALRSEMYDAIEVMLNAFCLGGVFFLARFFLDNRRRLGWLLAAGCCFGAAIGTRVVCIYSVVLISAMFAVALWRERDVWKTWGIRLSAFCLPIGFCLIVLGWYNYARFGSPLEFGYRYLLIGADLGKTQNMSTENFLYNFYVYVFQQLDIKPIFPYVFASFDVPNPFHHPSDYYGCEQPIGLLATAPMIVAGLPFFLWVKKCRGDCLACRVLVILVALFAPSFIVMCLYRAVTDRYFLDFGYYLVLASALALMLGSMQAKAGWIRLGAQALIWYTIVVFFLLNLTGHDYCYIQRYPRYLRSITTIGSKVACNIFGLRFPQWVPLRDFVAGHQEDLVITYGAPGLTDTLSFSFLGGNRWDISYSNSEQHVLKSLGPVEVKSGDKVSVQIEAIEQFRRMVQGEILISDYRVFKAKAQGEVKIRVNGLERSLGSVPMHYGYWPRLNFAASRD